MKSAKTNPECPKCESLKTIKSGIINDRQRYTCKKCNYNFTVNKLGKSIDKYYVIKALQLYLEGLSYREIERLLGVSHVSVINWVKQYKIEKIVDDSYHPAYQILNQKELQNFMSNPNNLQGHGMIITEVGDKYMLIKWERFREV
ncbi:MAG: transposase [Luteibaculaceae bacterium]